MILDKVHDIQQSYRLVLDAMSRPGQVVQVADQAVKVNDAESISAATALLAFMLLDTDTSFALVGGQHFHCDQAAEAAAWINQRTYARMTAIHEAHFLFILNGTDPLLAAQALSEANVGTLLNPHESATVIIEVQKIESGPVYMFRGPGILDTSAVRIDVNWDWLAIRNRLNREYPLGVDLVLVDAEHHLIGIPRTTQIQREVD